MLPAPSLGRVDSAAYMQSESESSPMTSKTTQHRLKHSESSCPSVGVFAYRSGSDERTMSLL